MKLGLPYELMENWTPQELLAVYDFCRVMSEAIWQQHEDTLLEQMIEADRENGHELFHKQTPNDTLELPFDDFSQS